jgi:peroxiredoxin
MARTPSTMPSLGLPAPDFALPDTTRGGQITRLRDFDASPALLVMFICNHCPFVKHVRAQLAQLGRDYQAPPRGTRASGNSLAIVAISSNDATQYPDDAPDRMTAEAAEAGYTFPYLYDESQDVARAYQAACTPDFFLYDRHRRLFYRGQLDDSRPRKYLDRDIPVTGQDLRRAIDAVLSGHPAPEPQWPSLGCNIKWRGE